MTNQTRVGAIFAVIGCAVASYTSTVSAHTNCQIYANYSLLQFRTNKIEKCELTGALWEGNFEQLVKWCENNDFADVQSQLKARRAALEACGGGQKAKR